MSITVVRHRPRPETAEPNQRLVEAVYAQLAAANPEGLSDTTFHLADGTFIHIADHETDGNGLESAVTARWGLTWAPPAAQHQQPETNPMAALARSTRKAAASS